ncbi:hypothetical protein [Prevotella dentasini]
METNTFIKHRSLPACIAAGYRLWSTHLSEILIRTKWHLLATSFFAACLVAGLTAAPGTGYRPLLFLAAWAASAVSLRRSVLSMIPPEARGRNTVALLLRHPGSHLILGAASATITLLVLALAALPLAILIWASYANRADIAAGHPGALHEAYQPLLFVTAWATAALAFFIQTWQTFAFCYLRGSLSAMKKTDK